MAHEDDEPGDDRDIFASAALPKLTPGQIDHITAILEAKGGAGHIDLEAEKARLRERVKAREKLQDERAMKVLDDVKGRISEKELVRRFEEAGVFEGLQEDLAIAATLNAIEASRVRNN